MQALRWYSYFTSPAAESTNNDGFQRATHQSASAPCCWWHTRRELWSTTRLLRGGCSSWGCSPPHRWLLWYRTRWTRRNTSPRRWTPGTMDNRRLRERLTPFWSRIRKSFKYLFGEFLKERKLVVDEKKRLKNRKSFVK